MCFGTDERTSALGRSDKDMFLDWLVLVDGVDLGIVDAPSADMAREWVEEPDRREAAMPSFGGTPGADGCPGSGFASNLEARLGLVEEAPSARGTCCDMASTAIANFPDSDAVLFPRRRGGNSRLSCRLCATGACAATGGRSMLGGIPGAPMTGVSLLDTLFLGGGRGALKSWKRVPRIRGS